MGNFLSLVFVENTKLWKRLSTKIMPLILIGLIFGLAALMKVQTTMVETYSTSGSSGQSQTQQALPGGWKAALEATDKSLQSGIDTAEKSDRQSEKNTLDQTKRQLAENKYDLKNNIKPATLNSDGTLNTKAVSNFWGNVFSVGAGSLVTLFAIIACTALVAGEFSDGTMKTVIPRPFSRWQILTAKLLVSVGYTVLLMVLANLVALASTAIFFGTGGAGDPVLLWLGGSIVPTPGFAAFALVTLLDLLAALVYLFLTFALSAITRSRAFATGLSIFLMFGGSFTLFLAYNFNWGKFIFFADTAFSTFIRNGAPFYGITLGLALLICGIYSAGFLAASYITFNKRDIAG
ncbi:ABC transporter permease [Ethanoligenens harbinense]|uniref:ABC transporter permease n=1 Tax=Ethanoligenens harbinense (strain DSM 18485 / JCM 12961 / CGMCC 1.5033 / YUAN-3) TaxID=663278 RepID=E6U9I6_ETHHY|nr:ABC transporter permease subunit [Ethanoligenens harbinense]ADU26177.1 hypothetical protein Ethha_0603 [Ethanoligenens harbinense YUAN-3]AVQ95315.1 hypothetical protein CXQ68_03110 [Ethanoligenens harbinense YUAN-3]AYF37980.1 hypothetical protein CXP51_02975 [Ethanoligenens harbinense]AYF40726.1 hypothetical protein CN246_03110 [Ethanoligenens harbinense]QCN91559.1 hypothetical protein DRA42_03115 [Ethanoligenens harbinense]